jgi:hypothetical protein
MMGMRRCNFRARGFEGRRDLASSLTSLGFVAILLLASTVEGEARCKHIYRPRANEYPRQEYYPNLLALRSMIATARPMANRERAAGWDWVLIPRIRKARAIRPTDRT